MGFPSHSSRAAAMALFLVAAAVGPSPARSQSTTCANDLIPCANYINGTITPPSSCCDSIKKAVSTELSCLCTLYETPGLLASFGVNVTQAVGLSQRCGVKSNLSACANSSTAQAPSGSTTPPAGVPRNDGDKTGMTGLSTLLLVLAASFSFY